MCGEHGSMEAKRGSKIHLMTRYGLGSEFFFGYFIRWVLDMEVYSGIWNERPDWVQEISREMSWHNERQLRDLQHFPQGMLGLERQISVNQLGENLLLYFDKNTRKFAGTQRQKEARNARWTGIVLHCLTLLPPPVSMTPDQRSQIGNAEDGINRVSAPCSQKLD